jgi:hypothetical protein
MIRITPGDGGFPYIVSHVAVSTEYPDDLNASMTCLTGNPIISGQVSFVL